MERTSSSNREIDGENVGILVLLVHHRRGCTGQIELLNYDKQRTQCEW